MKVFDRGTAQPLGPYIEMGYLARESLADRLDAPAARLLALAGTHGLSGRTR